MATSKTLTPTNVTISIPEFTDQPDQRVNSNCIDKEADAINTVNSKLTPQASSNLNDAKTVGIYTTNTSALNTPVAGYFTVYVIPFDANNLAQIAVEVNNRVMYFRTLHDATTWTSWQQLVSKNNFDTPEDKKITRIGSYFTERDAFKARRMGNTVVIFSYVNITTQVPSGTNFADTGFSSAEGMYIFMNANGNNATMVTCTSGKLRPSDSVLPTGYYYVSGCAVTPI